MKEKLVNCFSKKKGKVTALFTLTMVMILCICGTAFAESTTTDFTAVQSALTSKFTVAEVAALIASILGATVGFALLWWGSRKLVRAIISAFKSGKIKF